MDILWMARWVELRLMWCWSKEVQWNGIGDMNSKVGGVNKMGLFTTPSMGT